MKMDFRGPLVILFAGFFTAGACFYGLPWSILTAVCSVAVSALMVLWWRPSKKHGGGVFRMLYQVLHVRRVEREGKRWREQLEKDSLNVRRTQEETLLRRLRDAEETLYGRQNNFKSIKDSETFRKLHPITTYSDYEELIERVSAGEKEILLMEEMSLIINSGSNKKQLISKQSTADYFSQGLCVCVDVIKKAFPSLSSFQKTFSLLSSSPQSSSSEAQLYLATPFSSNPKLHLHTSPAPLFQVQDDRSALYLQLLFALRHQDVQVIESHFSSELLDIFRLMQNCWEDLVDDVRSGCISSKLVLDTQIRLELEKLVYPDPIRAEQLWTGFKRGFEGVALRLWPSLHLIQILDYGLKEICGESLSFFCGNVQIYSPVYGAAEGLLGVNLWPLQQKQVYALCPRSMFLEFLPEGMVSSEDTVLLDQVEKDKHYELIITTASGLYRYRVGDVVKVVGFHNQCAVVELLYRHSEILNVRGENVNELMFSNALMKAVSLWPGAKLLDYSCAESGILGDSSGGAQPHYLAFLELSGIRKLTEEQRYKLDLCLQNNCSIYKSFRIKGSIGPMRVELVSEGAFRQLKSYMTSCFNIHFAMFQVQRVIRRKELADFLLRKSVS